MLYRQVEILFRHRRRRLHLCGGFRKQGRTLGSRQASDSIHQPVFPGAKENAALSDMSLTAVLRRMKRTDITVHGFRSTFRDWCAESTNFLREVCEHALARSLPDKVEAAYRRGDLIDKRVQLMKVWADYCAKPQTEASVTAIGRQRKTTKRPV